VPLFGHSLEKINVLSLQTLRPERLSLRREEITFQQHVAGPTLTPVERHPSRMQGPIVEPAFDYPLRSLVAEMWFDWSQDAGRVVLRKGLEEVQQPTLSGKFIVVDESDEISLRVPYGLVSGQGNTLAGFDAVFDRDM